MATNNIIEKCKEAILIKIAEQYRDEAIEIIELTTDDFRNEFLDYHNRDIGNVCCLILDTAKIELIKEGKLTVKDTDSFGKSFE